MLKLIFCVKHQNVLTPSYDACQQLLNLLEQDFPFLHSNNIICSNVFTKSFELKYKLSLINFKQLTNYQQQCNCSY